MQDEVPVRNDQLRRQRFAYGFRLDEIEEALPELFGDEPVCIAFETLCEREPFAALRAAVYLLVCLVAHTLVVIEVHVVHAAVIRGERRYHPALLGALLLLFDQLFLQGNLTPHLILLHPALGFERLLLHGQARAAAHLHEQHAAHDHHDECRQQRLDEAAFCELVRYAAHLIGYDAFANKVREHPIGSRHGHVIERLPYSPVRERRDARLSGGEIGHDGIIRRARIEACRGKGVEKVVLARQAPQHHIGERHAVLRVDVAKRGIVGISLQREPFNHLAHVYFHETNHERMALEGNTAGGNGDDDVFLVAADSLHRYVGRIERAVVELVVGNVVLRAERGVDKPALVDERELFKVVKRFHLRLIGLQVPHVAEVFVGHQAHGGFHVPDIGLQVGLHNLHAPARQLVKVEHAYGVHGLFRGFLGAFAHPPRSQHEDGHDGDNPEDSRPHGNADAPTLDHAQPASVRMPNETSGSL